VERESEDRAEIVEDRQDGDRESVGLIVLRRKEETRKREEPSL
jgi:hypothetical protein